MTTVLVIDDNKETRSLFKLVLSDYAVLEAENGSKGLQLYEKHHPNIVLTDMHMPEMDGIEVIKEIKKLDSLAKIVVLTGSSDPESRELYAAGAHKVFLKPIQKRVLLKMIREVLKS